MVEAVVQGPRGLAMIRLREAPAAHSVRRRLDGELLLAARDERLQLASRHTQPCRDVMRERTLRDAVFELVGRKVCRVDHRTQEGQRPSFEVLLELAGKLEKVGTEHRLQLKLLHQAEHHLEDLLAFLGIGARTQFVDHHERSDACVLEHLADTDQLRTQQPSIWDASARSPIDRNMPPAQTSVAPAAGTKKPA